MASCAPTLGLGFPFPAHLRLTGFLEPRAFHQCSSPAPGKADLGTSLSGQGGLEHPERKGQDWMRPAVTKALGREGALTWRTGPFTEKQSVQLGPQMGLESGQDPFGFACALLSTGGGEDPSWTQEASVGFSLLLCSYSGGGDGAY